MSVQLIISPQSTEGTTTTTTTGVYVGAEFIVDGQSFNGMNSSTYNAASVLAMYQWEHPNNIYDFQHPPTSPNTWNRYTWDVYGSPANPAAVAPVMTSNNVVMYSTWDASTNIVAQYTSGIYQKVTGLTAGVTYKIRVEIDGVASPYASMGTKGYLTFGVTNTFLYPLVFDVKATIDGDGVIESASFVPTSSAVTICLEYFDSPTETDALLIKNISLREFQSGTTTTTTGFTADELHDQQILDLYEDETIPLTLSVDDFKDVATKTQSYSKAFHLPATKKNNRIFGNLFEITKASGLYTFNPYKKTSVMLKENGFIVFEGFLKLIDIVDKKGEISYNVNLYSDSVALMDAMKDLTFADLNLSELDHDYNLTSIEASQTGALPLLNALQADSFAGAAGDITTSVLKYPFLNWAGSIRRNATSGQVSDGATANRPSLKRLEDGFRPFINVKYLVDNIFKDAGFTYSSAFFDSSYFSNLYMDFNWGEEPDGAAPLRNDFVKRISDLTDPTVAQSPNWTNVPVNLDNGSGSLDLWNNSNYSFVSDVNNLHCTGSYRIQVANRPYAYPWWNVDNWTVDMRICVFNSSGSVIETIKYETMTVAAGGSGAISGSFDVVLNNGDYIQMEATTFNSDGDIYISDTTTSYLNITYNNNAVQVPTLLDTARGEMVQWDFLKGLFTMFNLITLQDKQNPSNILIEPYNDVFKDDVTVLDWTHKVDVSDIKLKALDLKKRVVFKYEEDEDDYPFRVYKNATGGYLYGSLTLDSEQLDLLSGEDEVIASPFAATIMKDLFDDTPELTAPSIYGTNEEVTEFGSIKNLPRILFDTGVYTASDTFYVPAQNGVGDSNKDHYSLFSHTSAVPAASTDDDLNFGACQLINPFSMGVSPVNNLYSTYYARYFQELYSPDVKSMTLKVLLTPNDISNFNFYDKVFIKNREYRVDKINYKPNDLSTVDFILIT